MRRISRPELPPSLVARLDKYQQKMTGANVGAVWKRARQTKALDKIAGILESMSGPRARCMYCQDSRGTDIEHFRPKHHYPEYAFVWVNLLLACAGCNRAKDDKFPLDEQGQPLLIDPTANDPWEHFVYVALTDEIAARWRAGVEDPRGRAMLEVLAPLLHQGVIAGRQRTRTSLVRAVKACLAQGDDGETVPPSVVACVDDDDYGLAEWFFLCEGADESPFSELRSTRPSVWTAIRERVQQRRSANQPGAAP